MRFESAFGRVTRSLRADLPASVVVFLVALPLCMGIAIASGVSPARGLLTGIIGGLVVGMLAGSPLQVSGPAAGLAVLVWQLVEKFGLAALGVAVLLGGVLQMAAGLLRAGQWFRAVSPAVIHGLLAGIGVLIFAGQFHVMVDDAPRGSGIENLLSIPEAVYRGIFPVDGSAHHLAAGVGLVTLASLITWNQFAPKRLKVIPGALIGVVVGALYAGVFALPIAYVNVPANLSDEITLPSLETFALLLNPSFLAAAVGLALIASAETLLCATAVDKMHEGPRTRYNRELFAQGVGNTLCGVVGALPMTGVIVRSSANVQAGAKTRSSAVLHGAWLLIFVVAFPEVLSRIPTSALAAILVYTGYRLAHPKVVKQLARHGRGEVGVFFATVLGIVVFDLLTGVALGFVLSAVKNKLALARLELKNEWSPSREEVTVRLTGAATFLALPKLSAHLDALPSGIRVHLDVAGVRYVDAACLELLEDFQKQLQRQGGGLMVDWSLLKPRKDASVSLLPQLKSQPEAAPARS